MIQISTLSALPDPMMALVFAAVFVSLFAMVGFWNQMQVALGKRKNEQPFIISMEERFVSQADHHKHANYVEGKLVTAAMSRKQIHETQEEQGTRIARLEEQNKSQTHTLELLSADFREFSKEQRAVNTQLLKRS